MKESKLLVKIFKALSNPHRLELYLNIKEQQKMDIEAGKEHTCFLSTLCSNINLGAPTLSHHLKELVNAELVTTQKQGKFLICSINEETEKVARDFFEGFSSSKKKREK
ncbi:MAG: helix-turn-helix domain-containing protein [Bacteriovoracaceae bacterium]